jgi:lipoprotein-releasing system permease protein
MYPSFAFYMAGKYVRTSWRKTLASLLGIAASVLLLLVIVSFANGLDEFMVERLLAVTPHIIVEEGEGMLVQEYDELEKKLTNINGIEATAPYLLGKGLLSHHDVSTSIVIRGVLWTKEEQVVSISSYMEQGQLGGSGALIGSALARDLGIKVGDRVSLLVSSGQLSQVEVEGIFSTGYYTYDSTLVYIPLDMAQELFQISGVTGIGLRLRDPTHAGHVAQRIQSQVGMWVQTWYEKNPSLLMSLALERKVMMGMVFFTFLVAGFGVGNLLYIQVLQRKEDIGILKALGISGRSIQGILLTQGMILGILGGVIGSLLAVIAITFLTKYPVEIPEIYYLGYLPISMKKGDFLLAFLVAIIATSLASLIPALKAAEISPMESLRRN